MTKQKKNADILFGASEHSALAIAEGHSERFSKFNIHPVFMREAIILVKKVIRKILRVWLIF